MTLFHNSIKSAKTRQRFICQQKQKPPVNNMGVSDTNPKVLVDWSAFTFKEDNPEIAFKVLGMSRDSFIKLERGLSGYMEQWRCGNIKVLCKGSDGMGVHVVISGQGCREYEVRFGDDWKGLMGRIKTAGGHFTRNDVAVDEFKQGNFIQMVRDKVQSGQVKSLFRAGKRIESFSLGEKTSITGESIYFGSVKSSLQVRIYDKAKEQGRDGMIWNRVEIQARDERADVLASEIISGKSLGEVALGVLKRYLNFIDAPEGDSNKSRWPVSVWWAAFLGEIEKVKLTIQPVIKSFIQTVSWIDKQVAPMLAVVRKRFGRESFDSYLRALLCTGQGRWKERHLLLLKG